ncbi:type VI secretion system contractile sheath large subunit, partial [Legionella pneumophila serogroup 2]
MDDSKQNPSKEESKAIMLDLLANMEVSMDEEQYQITKSGIKAFIDKIIAENRIDEPITSSLIDDVIAEIDIKLSEQVDEILHHPEFQKLESAWRSLKFLVDQTDFRENCQVNFINISKEELLEDFLDSPEIVKSGLYKQVYTAEYGQFGGKPYA